MKDARKSFVTLHPGRARAVVEPKTFRLAAKANPRLRRLLLALLNGRLTDHEVKALADALHANVGTMIVRGRPNFPVTREAEIEAAAAGAKVRRVRDLAGNKRAVVAQQEMARGAARLAPLLAGGDAGAGRHRRARKMIDQAAQDPPFSEEFAGKQAKALARAIAPKRPRRRR